MFVTLLVVLSSFFTVSSEKEVMLVETDYLKDNYVYPINATLVGHNSTTGSTTVVEPEPNPTNYFWGFLITLGSIMLAPVTGGWSLIGLVPGVGLMIESALPGTLEGLPIIGNILSGMDFMQQGVVTLLSMSNIDLSLFGGYPVIVFIIGMPIAVFFFIFFLRFVRGQ